MNSTKITVGGTKAAQKALFEQVSLRKMRQGELAGVLKLDRRSAGARMNGRVDLTLGELDKLAEHLGYAMILVHKECLQG